MPSSTTIDAHRFIIDNSVWVRLSKPAVLSAFRAIVSVQNPTAIMLCPPTAAELGYSARSGVDHTRVVEQLSAFPECLDSPRCADILDIQNRLWTSGRPRAVGAMDTLIAAYALRNRATVLHYDRDFEHVAAVMPAFKHQWIVPAGSVD